MVVQLDTWEMEETRETRDAFDLFMGESSLPVLDGVLPEQTPAPLLEILASMSPAQFRQTMFATWPAMMETSFAAMNTGQRAYMLDHVRGVLDDLEERYAAANHLVANPT